APGGRVWGAAGGAASESAGDAVPGGGPASIVGGGAPGSGTGRGAGGGAEAPAVSGGAVCVLSTTGGGAGFDFSRNRRSSSSIGFDCRSCAASCAIFRRCDSN